MGLLSKQISNPESVVDFKIQQGTQNIEYWMIGCVGQKQVQHLFKKKKKWLYKMSKRNWKINNI